MKSEEEGDRSSPAGEDIPVLECLNVISSSAYTRCRMRLKEPRSDHDVATVIVVVAARDSRQADISIEFSYWLLGTFKDIELSY